MCWPESSSNLLARRTVPDGSGKFVPVDQAVVVVADVP